MSRLFFVLFSLGCTFVAEMEANIYRLKQSKHRPAVDKSNQVKCL